MKRHDVGCTTGTGLEHHPAEAPSTVLDGGPADPLHDAGYALRDVLDEHPAPTPMMRQVHTGDGHLGRTNAPAGPQPGRTTRTSHLPSWTLLLGLAVLGAAWLTPLPVLAQRLFCAHMAMHVAVVAVAAPLLAIAVGGARLDPVRHWPGWFHPLPVSLLELIVIWTWHTPSLHHWSRQEPWAMALEQASFLVVGLALWLSAFGGDPLLHRQRRAAGVCALLMTSMHMTLLGVLLALAPRALYAHGHAKVLSIDALLDQQLGGVLMLAAGGLSYLIGGLYLLCGLLADRSDDDSGVLP